MGRMGAGAGAFCGGLKGVAYRRQRKNDPGDAGRDPKKRSLFLLTGSNAITGEVLRAEFALRP